MSGYKKPFWMRPTPNMFRPPGRSSITVPRYVPMKRLRMPARTGRTRTTGYYGRYKGAVGEMKFQDFDVDQNPIAAAGSILGTSISAGSLSTIPQGQTESTRIGRKSVIRQINWRYTVVLPGTAGVNAMVNDSDSVRIILYLDKQCNGVTAVAGGDTGILQTAVFHSFNNLVNKGRFLILMDRVHDLNHITGGSDGATGDTGEVSTSGTFFKKCNIPIEYDSALDTGVIATIRSNNLGCLCFTRRGLARIESVMRLRFTDS